MRCDDMKNMEQTGGGGEAARCALCALFLIAIAKDEMTRRKKRQKIREKRNSKKEG